MRNKIPIISLVVLIWLAACNFPLAPAAVSMNPNFLYNPSNPTATATPFQPIDPTAIFFPTATPVPTPTPLQIGQYSSSPSATRAGLLPQPKGQINILLLGSDQRQGSGGFRTDTIMLVTINPADNSVNITSFPRDLYVEIPGYTTNRINTAFARDGFKTMADTLEFNFGVRPDYYALINFWSFVDIVNSLGGVDVNASKPLSEYTAAGWFTIPEGVTHMDGETALYYSRSRYSTSDFDRNRRQQEVITAIVDKMMNLYTIAKIPELYRIYSENVTTNIKLSDVIQLIPVAARVKSTDNIQHYYVGRGEVTSWMTPGGAAVLLPNKAAIEAVLRKALNSP